MLDANGVPSKIMTDPTISVFLASYNYEKYVQTALRALLAQSVPPYELIIIEDASSDNSLEIIEKEVKNIAHVKIVVHKKNQGILPLLNEAFSLAKGDFVYGAAADDIVMPDFIEKIRDSLNQNPNVGIACANIGAFFNDNPSSFKEYPIVTPSREFPNNMYFFTKEQLEKTFRKTKLAIHGPACVYKKELVLKYGGFNPTHLALTDWYLAHKIALQHGMAYIPKPLVLCRQHSSSYSSKTFRLNRRFSLNKAILHTIESESISFQKSVKNSALLIQLGIPMIFSLVIYPKLWVLLPKLFIKKCKNLLLKVFR